MKDEAGDWQLFCYDSALDIWQREDSFHALCFAARGGELYALEADTGKLWAMTGRDGEPEGPVRWSAQSGLMHYQSPDRKYISRLSLYLSMAAGAELSVFLRYDSAGDWHSAGQVSLSGPGALTLPVRPRRCGHMELKLEGKGQVRLYSLARVLEEGSDMAAPPRLTGAAACRYDGGERRKNARIPPDTQRQRAAADRGAAGLSGAPARELESASEAAAAPAPGPRLSTPARTAPAPAGPGRGRPK